MDINLLFLQCCHNSLVVMLLYYINVNSELKPVKFSVISPGSLSLFFSFGQRLPGRALLK